MTGHGSATSENEFVQVLAEIRSVNNRYLKINVSGELDAATQNRIEAIVRQHVQRGTISVRLQLQYVGGQSQYRLNLPQILAYRQQLANDSVFAETPETLLMLPGVVTESLEATKLEDALPVIESAVVESLARFTEMRHREGDAMLVDLNENISQLRQRAEAIKSISPEVVSDYADRVTERINRLLQEHNVTITTAELVREIGLFSERVDTSEELVRLFSHCDQFDAFVASETSSGRKLDFLTQELLRETNTIGSKANDARIANHVVEMKTTIERIREMIQNVE